MNKEDLDTLEFFLSADPETVKNWYQHASYVDLSNANHLLNLYHTYLKHETLCIKIETKIMAMPVMTEAQAVIAAVRERD